MILSSNSKMIRFKTSVLVQTSKNICYPMRIKKFIVESKGRTIYQLRNKNFEHWPKNFVSVEKASDKNDVNKFILSLQVRSMSLPGWQ